MLFNSYIFIFVFLPLTLLVFFLLGHRGYYRAAIGSVVVASLFFYGWWDPRYLWLIAASMLFNYFVGVRISSIARTARGKWWMILGSICNLVLLGYYKYTNFLVENFDAVFGTESTIPQIVLPLGISFFTFTQIAYLVDAYRGETKEYNLLDYCWFVVFFPHLIAGPIVHHKELVPQFSEKRIFRFSPEDFSIGLMIFILGLYKKVVLADSIARFASPTFVAASQGTELSFFAAWGGALAYTLQIYFDFSGYSDMAIGLARMFGVLFPLNFNSPYKAVNVIDFWRRWHMTLSKFLRDYLYITLGGNRCGVVRRYANVFVTMLIGGIWHGAGWTFVIWGGLHGLFITLNHMWHDFRKSRGHDPKQSTWVGRNIARVATFLFIVVTWVFFRADSFHSATLLLKGMANVTDALHLNLGEIKAAGRQIVWTVALLLVVWFMPNVQEIMARVKPALDFIPKAGTTARLIWRPTVAWAVVASVAFVIALLHLSQITEFLYFQF